MSPIVLVDNLIHRYGNRLALDGISFDVAPGECFGLLGPNGGGKSTLFRILSTMLKPTSGRAEISGFDVVRQRHRVRDCLGVVFQSPSLDQQLTVRENLRHNGHLYGLRGVSLERRIDEMLGRLRVADRQGERVKTLSGGLRRRVEIAKSLLQGPTLLILDEPSTGLDPSARRELSNYLAELVRDSGTTVLLTTHDMNEADRCDRLAMLNRGRIVAQGSSKELKSRIGGDCITLETESPERLCAELTNRFGCSAAVVGQTVRIVADHGATLAAQIMEGYGSTVRSVMINKPSLEDVFVQAVGQPFAGEAS